ncbi:MAG: branched-chain amino acid ABC transporter permease [Deltaproteobacteria bacterium]|nr:branched-chain amino acid ABC transporter permease [Deltaproteobacteria bacterium]
MVTFLNIFIGGLLMGGIYALVAAGLSIQYGVGRVLNIAHGEFLMVGALITWYLFTIYGISPLISLILIAFVFFFFGFLLDRSLFSRLRNISPSVAAFEANSLMACFGLQFVIQNIAIVIWGAELKGFSYMASPVNILGALFGANRLITLAYSLGIAGIFYLFLTKTRYGKAIRAASQDIFAANLMGINIKFVLSLCFAFGALLAGTAGALISMMYSIHTTMGMEYTVIALIVIVLGGLGSITGSMLGGLILGIVGSIVSYLEPGLTLVAYYMLFMILLLVRPTGLMGRGS